MASMDSMQVKYLAMIQSVISRMAANQFTTRKWSVALGTAIIGWSVTKGDHAAIATVAILPASCFWILDAFYLSHERAFRSLYEQACAGPERPQSYTLKTNWTSRDWLSALTSPAIVFVHLPVMLVALGLWMAR
jgi:hypothetical protein